MVVATARADLLSDFLRRMCGILQSEGPHTISPTAPETNVPPIELSYCTVVHRLSMHRSNLRPPYVRAVFELALNRSLVVSAWEESNRAEIVYGKSDVERLSSID